MAVTHQLPLTQWYFEKTSNWTLDYPPFFAYFERVLAFPAAKIDEQMVKIENLDYNASSVVYY